jgi:hypothetical protein
LYGFAYISNIFCTVGIDINILEFVCIETYSKNQFPKMNTFWSLKNTLLLRIEKTLYVWMQSVITWFSLVIAIIWVIFIVKTLIVYFFIKNIFQIDCPYVITSLKH